MTVVAEKQMKVLFVHPQDSSFIQADLAILQKHFRVRVIDFGTTRDSSLSKATALWRLFWGVLWSDLTYAWFADSPAKWMVRFSRIFARPALVVVGGYEVAKIPEIGHGSLLDPKKTRTVKYLFNRADRVLPVDESLKSEAIKNLGVDGRNIQTVLAGHDSERFKPLGPKENMVLTVGFADRMVAKRKGLDIFVQTAKYLPAVKFVLVGSGTDGYIDELRKMASPNVVFAGRVAHSELPAYYQRAKVYCQLSMSEGLPNALCEAMLCECVPVGTEVNGIPTAIGDTGFYVPVGDVEATADAVRQALSSSKGRDARARIVSMFSVEKREKELIKIVEELAG